MNAFFDALFDALFGTTAAVSHRTDLVWWCIVFAGAAIWKALSLSSPGHFKLPGANPADK
jgi:hypothetical protein